MRAMSRVLRARYPASQLAALLACATVVVACGRKSEQPPTPATASTGTTEPAAPIAAPTATSEPSNPAPAVTQASWAPDALEELVAPIALYPDSLVGQILVASVNSQEVLDAGNWLLQNQNQNLKGDELDAAAQKVGFGPATRSLVQFPTVVDMMCQQIDWTRQLGSAFSSDQQGVLDAVQRLRAQAAQVGNLKSTPEQKVDTKTEDGKTVIEVQPANPQVVYVPQYNPQVVYTTPPPAAPAAPAAPAKTEDEDTVSTEAAVAGGLLAFGAGVLIGNAIHSDDYCYPHWGGGAVFVGARPFYPSAYAYRPAYGPAFRPAYGYRSPAGYRYAYNNNANLNRRTNVNINNSNYFNQFNDNRNFRTTTQNNVTGTRNDVRGTRNDLTAAQNNRAGTQNNPTGAGRNPSWKGQSSYAGARGGAQADRPGQAAGRAPRTADAQAGRGVSGTAQPRRGGTSSGTQTRLAAADAGGRPSAGTGQSRFSGNRTSSPEMGTRSPDTGTSRTPPVDRGYGGSSPGLGDSSRGVARSTSAPSRPADSRRSSAPPQQDRAFPGGDELGGGGFARAASARGNASAGASRGEGRGGGRRR